MEDFLSCDERDSPPFAGCLLHQALRAIVIVRSECVRQDALGIALPPGTPPHSSGVPGY